MFDVYHLLTVIIFNVIIFVVNGVRVAEYFSQINLIKEDLNEKPYYISFKRIIKC